MLNNMSRNTASQRYTKIDMAASSKFLSKQIAPTTENMQTSWLN
jgi:hypothetical protein